MALKTAPNDASVSDFIAGIDNNQKREFARDLLVMMERITGAPPRMWGDSIVGFGSYHYRYDSGREGDWYLTGFSPRKQNMTIYIVSGFEPYPQLMATLGKYRTGKSCLYVKKPSDVDAGQLEKLVRFSVDYLREKYPEQ
ncbi:MAG: DUF1801 domain-containing protein [Bacteroidota bacterium]